MNALWWREKEEEGEGRERERKFRDGGMNGRGVMGGLQVVNGRGLG